MRTPGASDGAEGWGDAARGRRGELPDWAVGLAVPDDARALEADRRAWLAERRRRRVRSLRSRHPIAFAVTVSLTAAVAAVVASVLGALLPEPNLAETPPMPLSSPTVAVGRVGGLLPADRLRTAAGPVDARSLRPAVVAVLPARCGCRTLLDQVAGQANEFSVPLLVVGRQPDPELAGLVRAVRRGPARSATDDGTLARTFGTRSGALTVLLVAPDGTVRAVRVVATLPVRLENLLSRTFLPAVGPAPASATAAPVPSAS